jgi:hypothetical protein
MYLARLCTHGDVFPRTWWAGWCFFVAMPSTPGPPPHGGVWYRESLDRTRCVLLGGLGGQVVCFVRWRTLCRRANSRARPASVFRCESKARPPLSPLVFGPPVSGNRFLDFDVHSRATQIATLGDTKRLMSLPRSAHPAILTTYSCDWLSRWLASDPRREVSFRRACEVLAATRRPTHLGMHRAATRRPAHGQCARMGNQGSPVPRHPDAGPQEPSHPSPPPPPPPHFSPPTATATGTTPQRFAASSWPPPAASFPLAPPPPPPPPLRPPPPPALNWPPPPPPPPPLPATGPAPRPQRPPRRRYLSARQAPAPPPSVAPPVGPAAD